MKFVDWFVVYYIQVSLVEPSQQLEVQIKREVEKHSKPKFGKFAPNAAMAIHEQSNLLIRDHMY